MFGRKQRWIEDLLAENERLHNALQDERQENNRLAQELKLRDEKSEAHAQSWGTPAGGSKIRHPFSGTIGHQRYDSCSKCGYPRNHWYHKSLESFDRL